MLIHKRLVFSDPKFWDDKNDTELLEIYRTRSKDKAKQSKPAKKVLALCFLRQHETIHHWKTFANGICGCCIEFDKAKFIKLLTTHKNSGEKVRFGSVVYKRLKDVDDEVGTIDDCDEMLPFTKRWPYRFEKEFRVIWEGNTEKHEILDIDLTMIKKITISQMMHEPLYSTIRDFLIKETDGLLIEKINPSTVYENRVGWIEKFKSKN